ncbi:MAG: ABC transporter ATP-binding protein [Clostridia bacterium]|nr:ABC transporter ATP-binding protein [Clostridia bacterium]
MIKRFVSYYKPHTRLFCLDMGAALLVALIAIVYPIVTRLMLNELIPQRQYGMILLFGSALLFLYLVRMLLNYFIQYQGHMMGVRMQAQMRRELFQHLEKLPYGFYDKNETGKIMSRMTTDLFDVSELAHHGPETVIISAISVIISFLYLGSIDWMLTLIIFACVPFLIVITTVMRGKIQSAFRRSKAAVAEINASVQSSISGIRVTKAFTNAEKETEKFEIGNEAFQDASRDGYRAMGKFHSGTTFITDIVNVVILIAGGIFVYNGRIGFGDYSAFVVSVNLFLNPINTLLRFTEQFQNGFAGFERFLGILEEEPEKDAPDAYPIEAVKGEIRFEQVSYGYDGENDVLKQVNLHIGVGKKFALVGPSGGGKTTICHLIPHFYDVKEGEIFIDDREIHTITLESLRKNIGIVQQDIYLFNASVRDNILYGRPDATEEEVVEAAKKANIHESIMAMEYGYDTVIGERGVRLSGGQKQRISIARVFLKNPAILILDEATSALDNTTEILIQKELDELCKGRTTLIVAHRLSTIKNADEIAVVDGGNIVEQGSHAELLARGGIYKNLYQLQFHSEDC